LETSTETKGGVPAGGIMQDILYSSGEKNFAKAPPPKPVQPPPDAPQPPDISWLARGDLDEGEDWVEDVPTALLLVPAASGREIVAGAFKGLGYQIVEAASVAEALERLRFAKFSAVVFHTAFEEEGLAGSFHRHLQAMPMDKRRYIFYVLIGPDFKTLYDLEALAHSANLVVNGRDLKHLPVILKKSLRDYEELFNPLIMTLREYGKR
jgi:CheY-like chemotaxis protein